jgi:hypothetical protein
MTYRDLVGMLEINGGYQGGTEQWAKSVTLRIDEGGFHPTHFLGRSGETKPILSVSEVAHALTENFDRGALLKVLDQIIGLRSAIASP